MSVVIVVAVAEEAEAIVDGLKREGGWGTDGQGESGRARVEEMGRSAEGHGGAKLLSEGKVRVVVGGIGRTNASAATTMAILQRKGGEVKAVVSAGIAGALPAERAEERLRVGECVVASACVYAEEGIVTSGGFAGMEGLGFSLGDFAGNAVPVSEGLLEAIGECGGGMRVGPIATVATCSGTDEAAREVVRRTGAVAEAMEGAAVVHAARRLGVEGIEVRVISNTTGERKKQEWDVAGAMRRLGEVMREVVERIGGVKA